MPLLKGTREALREERTEAWTDDPEARAQASGVLKHASATVKSIVRTDLVGARIVYNDTAAFDGTVEANRTTGSTFDVTLADRQNGTRPYSFRIDDTGLGKVQFLLFKDGDVSTIPR